MNLIKKIVDLTEFFCLLHHNHMQSSLYYYSPLWILDIVALQTVFIDTYLFTNYIIVSHVVGVRRRKAILFRT